MLWSLPVFNSLYICDQTIKTDEIGDVGDLQGVVKVNGETTGRGRMAPMQFSPQEVLAYCSEGENMFPGRNVTSLLR